MMVIIKIKAMGLQVDGAVVSRRLSVIFAAILQHKFEGPDGTCAEACQTKSGEKLGIVDLKRTGIAHPDVSAARLCHQAPEILPVKSAAKTLPAQDRIPGDVLGKTPVGKHIRKVELATRLKDTEDFGEDTPLVRRQVQNTVRDDKVNAVIGDPKFSKIFNVPHVKLKIAKAAAPRMPVKMATGDLQLGLRHINANDMAGRTHEL